MTDMLGGVRDAVDEPVADRPACSWPPAERRLALLVEPTIEANDCLIDASTNFGCAGGQVRRPAFRSELRIAIAHHGLSSGLSDDMLLCRSERVGHEDEERVSAWGRRLPVDSLVVEIGDRLEQTIELVVEADAEGLDLARAHRTRLTTKSAASRRASRSGRSGSRSSARNAASWNASARWRARSGPLDPRIS